MTDRRRGLGRGLDDLLAPTDWLKRTDIQLLYCPVDRLQPNPYQPRQSVSDGDLEELVLSIREKGILQPVLVTRAEEKDHYRIIAGERRWRAAALAGLTEIPVLLRDSASSDVLELALIENIQRRDLNCIEEALAYQRLQREFGLTREEIAQRVGKDRSTVSNLIRLLQLPSEIQEHVLNDKITMGHARALLGASSPEERIRLCGLIISRGLSVRRTEEMVARKSAPERETPPEDTGLERMREAMQARLGAKVRLRRKGKRGSVTISFRSDEEFRQLLKLFGLDGRREFRED